MTILVEGYNQVLSRKLLCARFIASQAVGKKQFSDLLSHSTLLQLKIGRVLQLEDHSGL